MITGKVIEQILERRKDLRLEDVELKRGGQKKVFRGDLNSHIPVVLKVINISDSEERERALREIQISSELHSEHFPQLFGYEQLEYQGDHYLYVIEEYIEGKNLRQFITEDVEGSCPISEIKRIVKSILEALEIIEPLKLVHRDIKPENIIINNDRIVLIDFGIARNLSMESITETIAVFGPITPGYSPPEQVFNQKRKISIRSDFFALGVLCYELLTGINPFWKNANSANEAINNVLKIEPESLCRYGYDITFDEFVFKCLQKHTHRRPANVLQAKHLFNKISWE